ncbi:MAG TPA: hypothetical protein VLT87_23190 [Thermoanaerobaculia bacterium]|nr:hypothetical protein [Thermoanaerobaculia bacterium]
MTRDQVTAAGKAFENALNDLHLPDDAPDFASPAVLGRRAALLAVAEVVWGKCLGPLFSTEDVRILLGVSSRQAVNDLARRGRILALNGSRGRKVYPAFQFSTSGRPYPEVSKVIEIFTGAVETPYTIASWFVSPQDLLAGETPVTWLKSRQDSLRLFEAARRTAEELAH